MKNGRNVWLLWGGGTDAPDKQNKVYLWLSSRRVECSLTRSHPTLAPRPHLSSISSLDFCLSQSYKPVERFEDGNRRNRNFGMLLFKETDSWINRKRLNFNYIATIQIWIFLKSNFLESHKHLKPSPISPIREINSASPAPAKTQPA